MSAIPAVSFDLERDSYVRDERYIEDEIALNEAATHIEEEEGVAVSPMKVPFNVKEGGLLRARDLECHKPLVNPGRPKLLGQLLDGVSSSLVHSDDKFKMFVAASEDTTAAVKACEVLDVKCTLKYSPPVTGEEEKVDSATNAMVFTFMFYAAMQQGGSTSFQATEIANETLSYFELDKFCRDFDLVPKLLTKNETKAIWMDFISMHAQQEGGTPLQALNFPQFQDMFVRMALFAYNKVGMKKMILSVTGFFPSAEDIVEAMCNHCQFNDFAACQRHIRAVGRETQGALNFRSLGDSNERGRAEIRIDLRAKFIARAAKKEAAAKEKAEAEKEKRRREKRGDAEAVVEEEKRDLVQYGLWSSLEGKKYEKAKGLFQWTQSKGKAAKSHLPSDILNLLAGKDADGNSIGTHSRGGSIAASREGSVEEQGSVTSQSLESVEELMTYDKSTALAKLKGTRIELISEQYSKELVKVLSKYSRTDPAPAVVGVIDSYAPFMDCGYLPPNTVCSLVISITNLSLDILHFNVGSENLGDEHTHIITSPKPLVSGMVRKMVVKFSVGDDLTSRLGVFIINAVNSTGLNHNLRVPVFYRSDSTATPRTLLSKKTLPDLCMRFLGRAFKPFGSFERQRSESGVTWLRPQSGNTTRRSTQEMRPTSAKAISAEAALRGSISRKLLPVASQGKVSSLPALGVPPLSSHAISSFGGERSPVSDRDQGSAKEGKKLRPSATGVLKREAI